ncbi:MULTISPECIES: ATP-binding protein [Brevibacterium]|mgnify:CR=1 FL=1|uniref:histidine kinase n=1 Tax=Brevibacterium casei TaxID=33889 RepID=A0A7T4DKM4_9MICO|nr:MULTISPECIES: ATP-binding protein [Brevibacterium]QQB14929.1 ATP-binding protein [Brevibacterium casei]
MTTPADETTRPTLSRALVRPVVRLSRRVRYGVAGRIMFANSVMLVGIMVLTTSLLYLQLSQINTARQQDLLRSAADSISLSLGIVDAGNTDLSDDLLAPSSRADVRSMLDNVVNEYQFDTAAVVPIDYLRTPPSLGSADRRVAMERNIVTASSGDIPDDSIDQLAASIGPTRILSGRSVVRFLDDGGEGGGTMYVVTPVFAKHLGIDEVGPNTVVGAVIVGNSADAVRAGFLAQSKWLIGIAIATLLLGIGASWVTSRGLRRVTGDYGANELRGIIEFYSSVLKAVSEGLLLIDRSLGIVLINAEARQLLGLPSVGTKRQGAGSAADGTGSAEDAGAGPGDAAGVGSDETRGQTGTTADSATTSGTGTTATDGTPADSRAKRDTEVTADTEVTGASATASASATPTTASASSKSTTTTPDAVESTTPEGGIPLSDLELPEALIDLLASGRWARNEFHYTDDRVLIVNQQPTDEGSDTWVVTMRDHTELAELTGELVSVRSFSDSLRAQTHEYANRLHMVISLLETGHVDEAIDFAAKDLDDLSRVTGDGQMSFDHPVLSALLLSKIAQAGEVGIDMTVDTVGLTGSLGGDDRDLATILGNLIDNAFDALSRQDVLPENKRVHVHLSGAGGASGFTIEVSDDGPGIAEEDLDAIFERGWSTKHDGVTTDSGRGRQQTGTRGVGLSLVVQAVRRLGGAIDVQGRGEDGDEFSGAVLTVWLPDDMAAAQRTRTTEQ